MSEIESSSEHAESSNAEPVVTEIRQHSHAVTNSSPKSRFVVGGIAAALIASMAIGAGVLLNRNSSTSQPIEPGSQNAMSLGDLAQQAATAEACSGDGPVTHVVSENRNEPTAGGTASSNQPTTVHLWLSGTQAFVQSQGSPTANAITVAPTPPLPSNDQALAVALADRASSIAESPLGDGSPISLPGLAGSPAGQAVKALASCSTPAEVRSHLLSYLQRVDGMQDLGTITDRTGRPGHGFRFPAPSISPSAPMTEDVNYTPGPFTVVISDEGRVLEVSSVDPQSTSTQTIIEQTKVSEVPAAVSSQSSAPARTPDCVFVTPTTTNSDGVWTQSCPSTTK